MKQILFSFLYIMGASAACLHAQQSEVLAENIHTLVVRVNNDWSRPPVADLNERERITISFDELSPEYQRFEYVIRHCDADWKQSSLFEIDYLKGFNNNPIEDYETSMNTLMEYTHYTLQIPNKQVQLTQSGNYEVLIYGENDSNNPVAIARFSLLDSKVLIGAQVSANTDIDLNRTHQQVSFSVNYNSLPVRNPQQELKVFVRQNNRTDNQVSGINPTYITGNSVRYEHNRSLIFEAGNEYRRFEMLSYYHSGMGIDKILRFGDYYHATLYVDKPRRNYVYDEDQNGIFIIRSDETNRADTEADYMLVHFTFDANGEQLPDGEIYLQGEFTYNSLTPPYRMTFNPETGCYENLQLMKQGYYNYQYVYKPSKGKTGTQPTEGNFYQTENEYQIYVYHRPFAGRADSLVGFFTIKYKN